MTPQANLHPGNTKSWTTVAVFSTYEEAKKEKEILINKHASVKIKRGKSSNKEVYKIKVWNPPKKEKTESKQKYKKGQSNRRIGKNVNKKIHSWCKW